ncbi:MAG: hypothetical protein RIR01_2244 [Bacteroidota bacterium]|jgi:hypothetical protein
MSNEIIKKIEDFGLQVKEQALAEAEKKSLEVKTELKTQITEMEAILKKQIADIEENSKKSISKIEDAINNGFSKASNGKKSIFSESEIKALVTSLITPTNLKSPTFTADEQNNKFFKNGQYKAFINTSDNSHAGAFFNGETQLGNIIEKLATINPVIDLVKNITVSQVQGQLAHTLIDRSAPNSVRGKMSVEGSGGSEMKKLKAKKVSFYLSKYTAYNVITSDFYNALQAGQYNTDALLEEFAAIEENDKKIKAASIFNGELSNGTDGIKGIIPSAQDANNNIRKYLSAAQGVFTFDDFDKFIKGFKTPYTLNPSFSVLIDKGILAAMFRTEGSDGHQKTERFEYVNGLIRIKTAQGLIRVIPVDTNEAAGNVDENDGFGNYSKFNDDFTANASKITTGFVGTAASDAGKLACVAGLFNDGYTLVNSSFVKVGVDNNFKDELIDGEFVMGKVSYAAGNISKQEALGVAVLKN